MFLFYGNEAYQGSGLSGVLIKKGTGVEHSQNALSTDEAVAVGLDFLW